MTLRDIKTFIIKQKNTIGLILGAVFLFVTTDTVYAASFFDAMTWIGSPILQVFNGLLYLVLQFLVSALLTLVGILIQVGQFRISMDSPVVDTGWLVVRDISNMFFVVILLLISFGTILRLDQYQLKNLLPKVILMAVVVNFSKLIVGFFIEISQVIMLTFVAAYSLTGAGNFIEAFKIPSLAQISGLSDYRDSQGQEITASAIFGAILGGIIYTITANVVVLAFLVIFIVRIVALWVLAVFSPLAFVLGVVPGGNQYASQWWGQFTKYLTIGPVLAFFLWLSLATLPGLTTQSTDGLSNKGLLTEDEQNYLQIPGIAPTDALQPISVLHFLLSTAMLVMSLYLAQSVGGVVGSAARIGMSSLSTIGKNMGGLRPLARYVDEVQSARTRVSANPYTYINAWKNQRDIRRNERTKEAKSFAEDIAKFGVLNSAKAGVASLGVQSGGSRFSSWRARVEAGIKQKKIEAEDAELRLNVGTGKHIEEQKVKFASEYQESTDLLESIDSRIKDLKQFQEISEKTAPLSKDDEKKLNELQLSYGKLTSDQIQEKIKEENKQREIAQSNHEAVKTRSEWSNQQVREYLVNQAKQQQQQQSVVAKALERKLMTVGEVDAAVATVTADLFNLDKVIQNLGEKGVDSTTEQAKQVELLKKLENLETYRASLQSYSKTDIKSEIDKEQSQIAELNGLSNPTSQQKLQKEILQRKKEVLEKYQSKLNQAGGDYYDALAEGADLLTEDILKQVETALEPAKISEEIEKARRQQAKSQIVIDDKALNESERQELEFSLRSIKKSMAEQEVQLAKNTLPKFYQEQARRSLIGDKLKEVQTSDSNELVREFRLAQAGKDKSKMGAVLHKLANDGNTNEILHAYGYSSNFDGFKQFYNEQVMPNYGSEQDALRLAMDVSYVNESRNHWDLSRAVSVDPEKGKLRWNSTDEHVNEVVAEVGKLNPQKIKREFNRLGYGGEIEVNGRRVFVTQKLAIELMKQQKDNLMDAAKYGGDLQKNAAAKLLEGLRNMNPSEVRRHGLDQLMERLDRYVSGTMSK